MPHLPAFGHVLSAVTSRSDLVALYMGKLALNHFGTDDPLLPRSRGSDAD